MRIETLALIIKVAESGSISKAAREGYVQQTTLSAAIKSVESELNIQIFERRYNGVALTREGKELIKLAEPMLELYHRMELLSQPNTSALAIHVNRLMYCYFCFDILPRLHMEFPESAMTISMATENPLKETYPQCPFDIGIGCCLPEELERRQHEAHTLGLELIPLLTSEFSIYLHKSNPLSKREQITDLNDMRDMRLVLANSFYVERFYISGLDKIVKSYSIMDPFDPMQLINAVSQSDCLAYAVGKELIPKRYRPLMDDIVCFQPYEPEGGDRHLRTTVHYVICRPPEHRTLEEARIVDFLAEVLR